MTDAELNVQGIEASEVVREVQAAIVNSGLDDEAGQGGLSLHTVTIKMVTVAELAIGAKPAFKVPIVGWTVGGEARVADIETHELEIILKTPWAPAPSPEGSNELQGVPDVRDALPGVVRSLRNMIDQASQGSAQLDLGSTKLTFKFQVTKDLKLELAVPSVERKRDATITVVFGLGPARP